MKDRPSQGNPHVQLTLGPVIQSFRPERKNKSQTQMQTAINAQQIRRKNTKSKKKQCETHWKIKASRHTTLPKLFANRFLYFVLNSQFTICPQIGLEPQWMKIKAKNIWVEYEIFGFTTFFLSV